MSNPRKVDIATEADWSFMDNPDVVRSVSHAAHAIARKYEGVVEEEDLSQEALLYLAVSPDMIAAHLADPDKGINYVDWDLRSYLDHMVTPEVRRSNRTVSSESLPVEDRWAGAGGGEF